MPEPLRIVSWNVNGLRACAKKGFAQWLAADGAWLVGLQEVRAMPNQLTDGLDAPVGWHAHFSPAERPGYSGVGLYARATPDAVATALGKKEFDCEGRVQFATFGSLTVANVYFPNGSGKERDNSRIPYKLSFYKRLLTVLKPQFDAGKPILVMGDFNTAHREIDLARPKSNEGTSGFCPEERKEIDRWVKLGWVDTFRHFYPDAVKYSWWSGRFGVRARNVGWRIDAVFASPGAMPYLKGAFIDDHVDGSDHCPVGVVMDANVVIA